MKQPNIVLICTDQQRFDTIEALGNPHIKTPSLNRLAANGVAFTRAYSPCPVCVPARYAMHTGQAPHRTGIVDNQPMSPRTSFMDLLAEAGYQTHGVGKMHFTFKGEDNLKLGWGFQSRDTSEEIAAKDDFTSYIEEAGYGHVHDKHGVRSEMYYIPQPSQLPAEHHHTAWVVRQSKQFLERRDPDKPFFLMSSFIKPHPPFESPTPWNKLYRGPDMPLPKRPDDYENLICHWNRVQNRYKYRDQGVDNHLIRAMKAAYYSAISFIDYHVGQLLDYMDSQGLLDNTLIIYTADHGEMLGDYHCYGKRNFLDSAARIPMLLSYPGCDKGTAVDKPVSLLDIFPTVLDYAGVERNENCSGESMLKIAEGETEREEVIGQFQRGDYGMYMLVTGEFKYIYSAPDQKEWLYDLVRDPEETRNRAENSLYAGKTEEMRERLIAYFSQEGYEEPIENNGWKKHSRKQISADPDANLLFQDPPASIPSLPGYETFSSARKYYRSIKLK